MRRDLALGDRTEERLRPRSDGVFAGRSAGGHDECGDRPAAVVGVHHDLGSGEADGHRHLRVRAVDRDRDRRAGGQQRQVDIVRRDGERLREVAVGAVDAEIRPVGVVVAVAFRSGVGDELDGARTAEVQIESTRRIRARPDHPELLGAIDLHHEVDAALAGLAVVDADVAQKLGALLGDVVDDPRGGMGAQTFRELHATDRLDGPRRVGHPSCAIVVVALDRPPSVVGRDPLHIARIVHAAGEAVVGRSNRGWGAGEAERADRRCGEQRHPSSGQGIPPRISRSACPLAADADHRFRPRRVRTIELNRYEHLTFAGPAFARGPARKAPTRVRRSPSWRAPVSGRPWPAWPRRPSRSPGRTCCPRHPSRSPAGRPSRPCQTPGSGRRSR